MGDIIYIGYDIINKFGVMSYLYVCDVIKSSCDVMHTECDVIHIVCVMSYREWVWYNGYTGFDDKDRVDVVSDIVGEMADITLCCHVCDILHSVCDVMNAVDLM